MTDAVRATAADAELVLKLYDLRREEVMRKARNFVVLEFWPQTIEELKGPLANLSAPESSYFRQVMTYWEMASALVLRGALHEELFDDTSAELYFLYAKFKPFIQAMRESESPEFMAKMEQIVNRSPEGRKRVERIEKRLADRRGAMQAKTDSYKVASPRMS